MSRVDEERDAARQTERLLQQKKAEEQKKNAARTADSAFSRMVQGNQQQKAQSQDARTARAAIAEVLKEAEEEEPTVLDRQAQEQAKANDGGRRALSRRSLASAKERQQGEVQRDQSQGTAVRKGQGAEEDHTVREHQQDSHAFADSAAGRKSDARAVRETMQGRRGENGEAGQQAGAGQGHAQGAGKTDPDASGKGSQGQGGDKQDKGSGLPQNFRLNPALMAPVPVAQKRDMAASDRLRRIASEIAQKIVERVRVGKNALGRAEFQIDLRSDVLSGLKVKVSSSGGKIQAVFSGSDREVLKMLEANADALKAALLGRGLTLEELKIEAGR